MYFIYNCDHNKILLKSAAIKWVNIDYCRQRWLRPQSFPITAERTIRGGYSIIIIMHFVEQDYNLRLAEVCCCNHSTSVCKQLHTAKVLLT